MNDIPYIRALYTKEDFVFHNNTQWCINEVLLVNDIIEYKIVMSSDTVRIKFVYESEVELVKNVRNKRLHELLNESN